MNGTERIQALLQGKAIDRTPIGGWYHMPLVDRNVRDFTEELIMSTDSNHWDFMKIMTNGHYYTEAYGGEIDFSKELTKWYGTIKDYPVKGAAEAVNLPILKADNPVFHRELEVLKRLKDYYRNRIPLVATIFNPLTALQECAGSLDAAPMKRLMEEAPEALHKGLEVMTKTNMNYLDALFAEGIDGIFLANQYSMAHIISDEQYEEFCVPYEKQIIEHCKGKTWFNMAHAHGDSDLRIEKYYDYGMNEIQALNWENCPANIPDEKITSIKKVRGKTDKILIAGIDQNHDLDSPENDRQAVKALLVKRFQAALKENGSNRFIFAPGCAMTPGGSYLNRLIYEVAEEYGRSDTAK